MKPTSGYSACTRRATSRKKPSLRGSTLCLVPQVTTPGRPAALRRRASSKAKRSTRSLPASVWTLIAKRPGPRSASGPGREPAPETERPQLLEIALDAGVEVLEVLAHDHEVDPVGPRQRTAAAGPPARGTHVRVGLLAPAQVVERERALAAGGAEQGGVGSVDRLARLVREGRPEAGQPGVSHRRPHPFDRKAEPVDQRDHRPDRLRRRVLALDHDHPLHGGGRPRSFASRRVTVLSSSKRRPASAFISS